jgi:decaprenylphospho-beta-D-erythro-pentofuranosid-2-ulose 2-reductase
VATKQKIVIVGATSAIAEHCARLWVKNRSIDLTLVGRDAARVEPLAADLRVRSPQSDIRVMQAEFFDPVAIQLLANTIVDAGAVDIVLIAHGALPEQGACQSDLSVCKRALEINAISPVLYAESFAARMVEAGCGTLVLMGSVAGDRGRKSNYVYGAAKGLVARYAQGLQHRFAGTGVNVVLIKPGPTDTPMTAHLKKQGAALASVDRVAESIVAGVAHGKSVVYAPSKWRWIMAIIQHLPSVIFNKLNI